MTQECETPQAAGELAAPDGIFEPARIMQERSLRWLLLVALVVSLAWIALPVPLFDFDEGAFSEVSREMVATGDFITPRLNGRMRHNTPVLIYWCQSLSGSIFGFNEFSMRLPSVIAAVAWVLALVRFGSRWTSERRGMLAGILLTASLQVTLIAKAATAESLLNLFLALAMFAGYQFSRTGEKRQIALCYVFVALGFLAKGPVALLIPLATAFLVCMARKDPEGFARGVLNPLGIGLFLLIVGPWFLLEYMANGTLFIEGLFLDHNVARFGTPFGGYGGSLFYYIPVVLIGILPFTGVLVASLRHSRQWFGNDLERFCALWFLFVLIFFSLSGIKLHTCIVYGYTPLFLLMAGNVDRLKSASWALAPTFVLLLFFLFVPELAAMLATRADDEFLRQTLSHAPAVFGSAYRLVILLCLGILVGVMIQRRFSVPFKIALAGIITLVVVNGALVPGIAHLAQSPVKQAGLLLREEGVPVSMVGTDNPSLLFYARRTVARNDPEPGDLVFTRISKLPELEGAVIPVFKQYGYVLGRFEKPTE